MTDAHADSWLFRYRYLVGIGAILLLPLVLLLGVVLLVIAVMGGGRQIGMGLPLGRLGKFR